MKNMRAKKGSRKKKKQIPDPLSIVRFRLLSVYSIRDLPDGSQEAEGAIEAVPEIGESITIHGPLLRKDRAEDWSVAHANNFGDMYAQAREALLHKLVKPAVTGLMSRDGGVQRAPLIKRAAKRRYERYRKEFFACKRRSNPSSTYATIIGHVADYCGVSKRTIARATRDLKF